MPKTKRTKKAAPKHKVKKPARKASVSPGQRSFFTAIFAVFNAPVK